MRNLILILGDQLDRQSSALDGFDDRRDAVWMAEVNEESEHVWSHKARIAVFLSAMRHFRDELEQGGHTVHYWQLDDRHNPGNLEGALASSVSKFKPDRLVMVEAGEYRVKQSIERCAEDLGAPLETRPDRHFIATREDFAEHAKGRKQLRLEYFYRELRRRTGVLMDGDRPVGGKWNFDADNRTSFSKSGPDAIPAPRRFNPDQTTRDVLTLVEKRFADHPGKLAAFDWPVTPDQAAEALDDFIEHRLPDFGRFQDAMWADEPYLYHSRLSVALNLKLLDARDVVRAAEAAYRAGQAPLNSVEGFIRQILGWREYVRGIYWRYMPEYLDRNTFQADRRLPDLYWSGETDMHCLRQAVGQTMEYGYAHHIQRLMVTGLFALLLGVDPRQVHRWYLAVYVDAVEWVELPNSLGMSQYADDGLMASKPYVATGKYIQRMSNYCGECRFDPAQAIGEDACPFTTLYWDFLMRHRKQLGGNHRMSLQLRNIDRKTDRERREIKSQALRLRHQLAGKPTENK